MEKLKDMYANFNGREKGLFFGALGCILFLVLDMVVLGPILSHINVLDEEITSTSQAIQRDLRILSFKKSIMSEYEKYEKFMDSGDKSQEEIIAALLRRIENYATQNSIKMINVTPGDIEEKPIYQIYKTSLEFEGSLPNVLQFMNLLEESDGLFQVTRYDFKPKSKSGAVLKVDMDISRVLINLEDIARDPMESMEDPGMGMTEQEMDFGGPMDQPSDFAI